MRCQSKLPITMVAGQGAISSLAAAARNMPQSSRALWESHLSHIYGEMGGQRAVRLCEIASTLDLPTVRSWRYDALIGLETYFVLLCDMLAISAMMQSPSRYLESISTLSTKEFRKYLDTVLSGTFFEDHGLFGGRHAFEYSWVADTLTSNQTYKIQEAIRSLSNIWEDDQLVLNGNDPLQEIHHSLFPKNLLHITGQFYTPQWLSDLLLSDLNWSPDTSLIDPFCGSGVFLLAALERAHKVGADISDTLALLCGIDLNPTACAATRANIVLYCARKKVIGKDPLYLNILGADSLAPAIMKGKSEGHQHEMFCHGIKVDGEAVELPDFDDPHVHHTIQNALKHYGLPLQNWFLPKADGEEPLGTELKTLEPRDRRIWEQLAVFCLLKADSLVTNPPWVGWEYISRPYRDEIRDAWLAYDLFKTRGLDAAFLKEDLSTLALLSAWDLYLREKGESTVVLRPAVMRSDLNARGLRRLSLVDYGTPLELQQIREFQKMRVFPYADTETATWKIRKGIATKFPVKTLEWTPRAQRWRPSADDSLTVVHSHVWETEKVATRTQPEDYGSRWITTSRANLSEFLLVQGTNEYVPRMGVFTGGANGVFYLRPVANGSRPETGIYENVRERIKRHVPRAVVELEKSMVFPVLRGRDIQMWHQKSEVFILCPHTSTTKMYPLREDLLRETFPFSYEYFCSMKSILQDRKGFAGWEKKIKESYFYSLQRIGPYTFSPYKVCWKYIASEFTVCVVDIDREERLLLPNDKVMFVGFDDREAAYFFGGLLSSQLVRNYINSSVTSRQVSANVLKSLSLPLFDRKEPQHCHISELCREGHLAPGSASQSGFIATQSALDKAVQELYGIPKDKETSAT